MSFKIEPDNWFWELVRLDELGLPESWNFVVPDKLAHALTVFVIAWIASRWVNRHLALLIGWGLMMGPWEVVWDGMFRHGLSIPDSIANTVGGLLAWWWLGRKTPVGQSQL